MFFLLLVILVLNPCQLLYCFNRHWCLLEISSVYGILFVIKHTTINYTILSISYLCIHATSMLQASVCARLVFCFVLWSWWQLTIECHWYWPQLLKYIPFVYRNQFCCLASLCISWPKQWEPYSPGTKIMCRKPYIFDTGMVITEGWKSVSIWEFYLKHK